MLIYNHLSPSDALSISFPVLILPLESHLSSSFLSRTMDLRSGSSYGGPSGSGAQPPNGPVPEMPTGVLGVLQGMMQQQQQQTALLREGILAAQQTAAIALERAVAPREARPGNVADFRRLLPRTFAGTGTPLEAEQWLVDMGNLLRAAKVPEADQVEAVVIQLEDIALVWWLAEEPRMQKPVEWKTFSDAFLVRFFPKTAKREMEERFCQLRQQDLTVDAYAAEFARLSRFAPSMVAEEEDRAHRFQQGLRIELQRMMVSTALVTYADVLDAAHRAERVEARDDSSVRSAGQGKRPFAQISGTPGPRQQRAQPYQQYRPVASVICSFCQRPGHIQRDCRRAHGLCLRCGSPGHVMQQCPLHQQFQGAPRLALPAPPRPAVPVPPRPSMPLQLRPEMIAVSGPHDRARGRLHRFWGHQVPGSRELSRISSIGQ